MSFYFANHDVIHFKLLCILHWINNLKISIHIILLIQDYFNNKIDIYINSSNVLLL